MARLYGRTTTKKDFQGLWYDLDLDLLFRWFYHTEGNVGQMGEFCVDVKSIQCVLPC